MVPDLECSETCEEFLVVYVIVELSSLEGMEVKCD